VFVIQFAGNPNCVSDVFSNILKPIKETIKAVWHGASLEFNPALCMTIRGGVTDITWLSEARLSMAL